MGDSLKNELEEMNKRLAELQADNIMLKITINSLVDRLDDLEGTSTVDITEHKSPSTKKKSRSSDKGEKIGKKLAADAEKHKKSESISEDRVSSYWVGKKKVFVVAPEDQKEGSTKPPAVDLRLDYIYGYNGKNARGNLYYSGKGSGNPLMLYSIAGVAVVYDAKNNTQRFFRGHNEDITALCLHPTEPIAASGQLDPKGAGKPYVCIWDINSMKELKRIEDFHDRGIAALGFSAKGNFLATVGEDDSHTMAIWEWKKSVETPVAQKMVSKDSVYGLTFNHFDRKNVHLCTFGVKLCKLWVMEPSESKDKNAPKYDLKSTMATALQETGVSQKAYYSAAYAPDGNVLVGTATGSVYVFKAKGKLAHDHKDIHPKKAVGGICLIGSEGFATAGSDGFVRLFNASGQLKATFELAKGPDGKECKPRALDYAPDNGGTLCVGTSSNTIIEISLANADAKALATRMEGHFGEVWGLAVHPKQAIVATGAHDKILRFWDYSKKAPVSNMTRAFKHIIRSVAFNHAGNQVAVGFLNGRVAVLEFPSLEELHNKKHRQEQIDALQYSPNDQILAMGSWDQCIELLNIKSFQSSSVPKNMTLKGHTSSVTHLTFSTDCHYIMSNSKDYEILYWEVATGQRVESSVCADAVWDDWQNILGWPVQGIFGKGMDGTDINAVSISGRHGDKERTIAAGDDFGTVNLYRYPCTSTKAQIKKYPGHSSHVTNVRWTPDSRYLFSDGGMDMGVFQWRVK